MSRGARALALLITLAVGAGSAPPSVTAAPKAVAFPDGEWDGTAFITGSISRDNIFASGEASFVFSLAVDDGQVVDGRMDVLANVESHVSGDPETFAEGVVTGELELAGTAEEILVNGPLDASMVASVPSYGIEVPLNFSGENGIRNFRPTSVTCNRVIGEDIAVALRGLHERYGFQTSVRGGFVAIRVPGSGRGKEAAERYAALVDQMTSALQNAQAGTPPTEKQLRDIVAQVLELNKTIHDVGACGPPPEGFEKGLADPVLQDLFNQIMVALLENHASKFAVGELTALLLLTAQVGLGPEAEDAFVEELASRIPDLVDELGQGVGDDVYTAWPQELKDLHEIYTTAQLLGLKDLEAVAKRALDDFVMVGGGGGEPVEV